MVDGSRPPRVRVRQKILPATARAIVERQCGTGGDLWPRLIQPPLDLLVVLLLPQRSYSREGTAVERRDEVSVRHMASVRRREREHASKMADGDGLRRFYLTRSHAAEGREQQAAETSKQEEQTSGRQRRGAFALEKAMERGGGGVGELGAL